MVYRSSTYLRSTLRSKQVKYKSMKVISNRSVSFPSLGWGINAGEVKELPQDKEAQEAILARPFIQEASNADSKPENPTPKTEKRDETKTKASDSKATAEDKKD